MKLLKSMNINVLGLSSTVDLIHPTGSGTPACRITFLKAFPSCGFMIFVVNSGMWA